MTVANTPSVAVREELPAGEEPKGSLTPRNDAATIPALPARKVYQLVQRLIAGHVLRQRKRSVASGIPLGRLECCKCPEAINRTTVMSWKAVRAVMLAHVMHVHPVSFAAHCGNADGAE